MANNPKEYLLEPSLWYRNVKDFVYTVKVFETVLDPSKLSSFFTNTEEISVDQLYDARGKIKPAGSPDTANDTNTIFGTVESWSGENGVNDARRGGPVVKLSDKQKAKVKEECRRNAITFLSDVKDPKHNQIVYVYGKEAPKNSYAYDPDDPSAGFYVYWRDTWVKINEDTKK